MPKNPLPPAMMIGPVLETSGMAIPQKYARESARTEDRKRPAALTEVEGIQVLFAGRLE
jgi:hypothetical protein